MAGSALWASMLVFAVACGGDDDGSGDVGDGLDDDPSETGTPGTTGDTGTLPPPPPSALVVDASATYHLTTEASFDHVTLRQRFDALVDWDEVTTDMWGEPLPVGGVPELAMFEVLAPPDEIEATMASDDLAGIVLSTWTADVDTDVFAHLSDLTYGSTPFDPQAYLVPEFGKTWVVALVVPDGERMHPLSFHSFELSATAGDTAVPFTDATAAFTWSAALDGAPIPAPAGVPEVTIDWSTLTTDALGKTYDPDLNAELFVGQFDEDLGTLAANVRDLEAVAEQWWTMDVEGDTDARLSLARDSGGTLFPGFATSGTWLVGVRCPTCLTPFPAWIVALDVL